MMCLRNFPRIIFENSRLEQLFLKKNDEINGLKFLKIEFDDLHFSDDGRFLKSLSDYYG